MREKTPSFKDVFIKGAVIYNPVLIQLVGLCPVVAASSTLKGAFILSVAMCAELIVTCVIASALFKKIPRWVRMALYLIIGLALICPALWYIETQTLINLSLGMKIYIPLIAINSVTAVHCEQVSVKSSVKLAFYDAAAVGIGASVVFILAGVLRELIGSGSLGGIKLDLPIAFKGMLLPFGCLVILGFLAAGLKSFLARAYPESESDPVERQKKDSDSQADVTEVEIFDEFWNVTEEPEEAETVGPEIQPEPEKSPEDIRLETAADIDAFFKSLGIDLNEKGDKR